MREIILIWMSFLTFLIPLSLNGQAEICWNRIDDDGDGLADCKDEDCFDYKFCFDCDDSWYVIFNNQYLATLDPVSGVYVDIVKLKGIKEINGIALNSKDGHLYASSILNNGSHQLILLGNDGTKKNLDLKLPSEMVYFMGSINDDNEMYLGNYNSNIIKIDLKRVSLSTTDTGVRLSWWN